jgi:hypothetical protein
MACATINVKSLLASSVRSCLGQNPLSAAVIEIVLNYDER